MSAFDDEIAQALPAMFDSVGDDVFINNMRYRGIFEDDFYQDETGERQDLLLSLAKDDISRINVGDPVEINGINYRVRNIADIQDPLIPIELHRA